MTAPHPSRPEQRQDDGDGVLVHKKWRGEDVALCGFVFRPSNVVGTTEAVEVGAKRCPRCEVEYLELLFELDSVDGA